VRKWSKRIVGAGLLAGTAYAVWRAFEERVRTSPIEWTPAPFPSPPMPVLHDPEDGAKADAEEGAKADADGSGWIAPVGDACPASHPVKAKLASGIYHPPGGLLYERTITDRCYVDSASAEADGLRASKR
jgi:hypothetical protein